MSKIIFAKRTGHTLHVSSIDRAALPANIEMPFADKFDKFYVVKNWDSNGVVFFYLAKGNKLGPNQICGFYGKTGKFWSGYGKTLEAAIDGMQADGWMYA
jgi:hypothetical protein